MLFRSIQLRSLIVRPVIRSRRIIEIRVNSLCSESQEWCELLALNIRVKDANGVNFLGAVHVNMRA